MAHDTKRKAPDVPATYAAPDAFVEPGLSLPLALLGVDALLTPVLVAKTVGMTVPVGISEDGTADIGLGAGLPAGGGQNVRV